MSSASRRAGKGYLTVPEVAWLLQRSERDVRKLVSSGRLTALTPAVGARFRFEPKVIESWLGARAAMAMGEILRGRTTAPRAERPWQLPPPVRTAHFERGDER
jgi:excisionase family DNA binding protein